MSAEIRRASRVWTIALLAVAALPGHAPGQMPGGLPPSYRAADRDPRLTEIARTALPIVAALERYRADRGAYPDLVAAAALPIEGVQVRNAGNFVAFGGWLYHRRDGAGYVLSYKLGWDPRLLYERGARPRWVFDPGDGSAEKEIVLQP